MSCSFDSKSMNLTLAEFKKNKRPVGVTPPFETEEQQISAEMSGDPKLKEWVKSIGLSDKCFTDLTHQSYTLDIVRTLQKDQEGGQIKTIASIFSPEEREVFWSNQPLLGLPANPSVVESLVFTSRVTPSEREQKHREIDPSDDDDDSSLSESDDPKSPSIKSDNIAADDSARPKPTPSDGLPSDGPNDNAEKHKGGKGRKVAKNAKKRKKVAKKRERKEKVEEKESAKKRKGLGNAQRSGQRSAQRNADRREMAFTGLVIVCLVSLGCYVVNEAVLSKACNMSPDIKNSNANKCIGTAAGRSCTFQCDLDYYASSTLTKIECNSEGIWSDLPVCTKVDHSLSFKSVGSIALDSAKGESAPLPTAEALFLAEESDAPENQFLQYEVLPSEGSVFSDWLSFDEVSRKFRGTPENDGEVAFVVRATKDGGETFSAVGRLEYTAQKPQTDPPKKTPKVLSFTKIELFEFNLHTMIATMEVKWRAEPLSLEEDKKQRGFCIHSDKPNLFNFCGIYPADKTNFKEMVSASAVGLKLEDDNPVRFSVSEFEVTSEANEAISAGRVEDLMTVKTVQFNEERFPFQ